MERSTDEFRIMYRQVTGSGPDICFIHGWALNHRVWNKVAQSLANTHRVTCVDLPGHGRSPMPPNHDYSRQALADALATAIPEHSIVVGWSLGGLIALQYALSYSNRVNKLVLVACSPQFVRTEDWPDAMDPAVLDEFAIALCVDYRQTVLRFLALQSRGSEYARQAVRELRDTVFAEAEPNPAALRGGLDILKYTKLRTALAQLDCPVLWVGGNRDRLVAKACIQQAARLNPHSREHLIAGAGHAPFISHTQEFLDTLNGFIDE